MDFEEEVREFTDEERARIKDVITESVSAKLRIKAEQLKMNEDIKTLCKDLSLDKKVLNKMIKVYYNQNFDDEVASQRFFEQVYTSVVA